MKILFVCTANICRSPMAEYMLKARVGDAAEVASAGVFASGGHAATEHCVEVLKGKGVDGSGHKSQLLVQAMLDGFDLIYCMTKGHINAIQAKLKPDGKKLKWIGELTECGDVADPWGGSLESYEHTYADLLPAIEKLARQVKK